MAKPHVLNINDEDFEFALLGLSILKDQYETAITINNTLLIRLELNNHFSLALKDNKLFRFSLFSYFDKEFGIEYLLVPNASNFEEPNLNAAANADLFSEIAVEERSLLIKELPKTDYFLILKGEEIEGHKHKIIQRLKTMDDLLSVQLIDVSELPSKSHLVF
ncbi:MAG: IPExxxVDY family protein [Bacteroidia bacterium]|nr:IPExxxVDY family protein [Bacteroidia bacterium]